MDKKENYITKPIIISCRELRDSLVNVINNSQLPAFIAESIVKDLLTELNASAETEYRESLMEYQKQLMAENVKQDTEEKATNKK